MAMAEYDMLAAWRDLPVSLGAMDAIPPALRYRIRDVLRLCRRAARSRASRASGSTRLLDGRRGVARRRSVARRGRLLDDRGAPRGRAAPARLQVAGDVSVGGDRDAARGGRARSGDAAAGARAGDWTLGYRQLRATAPGDAVAAPRRCSSPTRRWCKLADAATARGQDHERAAAARAAPRAVGGRGGGVRARARAVGRGDRVLRDRRRSRACCSCVSTTSRRSTGCARCGWSRRRSARRRCRCCSRARRRRAIDEQLEMLFLAIALARRGASSAAARGRAAGDEVRRPAARSGRSGTSRNRGVVPTVRGLRVARSTAVIAAGGARAKCCGRRPTISAR